MRRADHQQGGIVSYASADRRAPKDRAPRKFEAWSTGCCGNAGRAAAPSMAGTPHFSPNKCGASYAFDAKFRRCLIVGITSRAAH
jgi:hypothetical protein